MKFKGKAKTLPIAESFIEEIKERSVCSQCGSNGDFMVAFTNNKICGKCTRKNHKQAIK